jgi:hypothetical protein
MANLKVTKIRGQIIENTEIEISEIENLGFKKKRGRKSEVIENWKLNKFEEEIFDSLKTTSEKIRFLNEIGQNWNNCKKIKFEISTCVKCCKSRIEKKI